MPPFETRTATRCNFFSLSEEPTLNRANTPVQSDKRRVATVLIASRDASVAVCFPVLEAVSEAVQRHVVQIIP